MDTQNVPNLFPLMLFHYNMQTRFGLFILSIKCNNRLIKAPFFSWEKKRSILSCGLIIRQIKFKSSI